MVESGLDQARVLVIGLGELAEGDASVGRRAVTELQARFELPGYVQAVTAAGVDTPLLELMEEASFIIVADCVAGDETPGAIFRVALDEFARPGEPPESCHEQELLASLGVLEMLGGRPPAVLLSLQVGEREPRPDLSPAVAEALPALVERLVEELVKAGAPMVPRL